MKPQDESSAASLLGLRRSKHGDRTLPWRRWNRPRRRRARALLAWLNTKSGPTARLTNLDVIAAKQALLALMDKSRRRSTAWVMWS